MKNGTTKIEARVIQIGAKVVEMKDYRPILQESLPFPEWRFIGQEWIEEEQQFYISLLFFAPASEIEKLNITGSVRTYYHEGVYQDDLCLVVITTGGKENGDFSVSETVEAYIQELKRSIALPF